MKLLLGSKNTAKIEEYKKYLVRSNLCLVTLKEIGFIEEPLEIGKTFGENALQKARFYAEQTEYPTLGEDGGFEIDALDGEPGVYSRRWVGEHGTDEDRIQKVFDRLAGIPPNERAARLKLVVIVYFPAERDYITVERSVDGIIPLEPSETRIPDFPYRSVLFLPKYNKYYCDLTDAEHDEVNHRKDACRELLLKLEPYIN